MITKTQLLRYLRDQMPASERIAFEAQLVQYPHWQDTVDTLQQSGLTPDEIERYMNDIVQQHDDSQLRSSSWGGIFVKIAAAVLLLISCWSVWGYYQTQQPQQEYAHYLEATEANSLLAVRGATEEGSEAFQTAMTAYQAKNYQQSYMLFEMLRELDPFDQTILQMTARSAMHLGDYYTAEQLLDQSLVLQATPAEHTSARWYLALTHLQLDSPIEAKTLLTQIAQDSRGLYGEQARKLLTALNSSR